MGWALQTRTNRFETLAVFPSKCWQWSDGRPLVWGLDLHVFDLEGSAWYIFPDERRRTMPTETDAADLRDIQALVLMETRWQRPAIMGVRKDGIRRSPVIQTQIADELFEYNLAPDTYLPFQVVATYISPSSGRQVVRRYRLSAYNSVSGIQLPHRIDATLYEVTYHYTLRYEVNVAYDETIFTAPTLKDDPRSWQAAKQQREP
jgi:hypothetical protein